MTTAELTYGLRGDVGSTLTTDRPLRNERKLNSAQKKEAIIAKDRRTFIIAILVVGMLLIGIVIVSAYTANLKYTNNTLIAQNEELQDDIDSLNVKIQTATNLGSIEKAAKTKLGMVYPKPNQYVYVGEEDTPNADFASTIKHQAYN